jgi:hypothetical protein
MDTITIEYGIRIDEITHAIVDPSHDPFTWALHTGGDVMARLREGDKVTAWSPYAPS